MSAFSVINYEDIFQLASIGMCVSRQRVIYSVNDSLAAMFGYEPGELAGRSLELLYPSLDEFERTGERVAAGLAGGAIYADERIMRRAGGELFWCHVSGRALTARNPHAVGVWTFEDLSARRPVHIGMTPREREVAALLLEGKTSKLIARQIDLSPRTVEMHRANLMRKFGAATSHELVHKLSGLT
ncbi:PAS and helix-turn-helix domain-containing protein [Pseudoduganella namucuonensis]|uniref:PAS domain S-box-containing protein n=1 Tax=Pseudoduganella namucuonensis TaxID=1035707 RepID=A0A1I7F0N6_9BURK|nr:PAS and helix-turn-helix domain-containing protein [Pseudoduganella namucuonensis]SFU29752.1 PAS domain S-box-containing protein [Pseudoduganella namucuonensis]